MHEDELNIGRRILFIILRVTFFVVVLLWLTRDAHFLGGFVNMPKFFWILFIQGAIIEKDSTYFIRMNNRTWKCLLLPVLINELATFRSLAKVKQKLRVSLRYTSLIRFANFSTIPDRCILRNNSCLSTPFTLIPRVFCQSVHVKHGDNKAQLLSVASRLSNTQLKFKHTKSHSYI